MYLVHGVLVQISSTHAWPLGFPNEVCLSLILFLSHWQVIDLRDYISIAIKELAYTQLLGCAILLCRSLWACDALTLFWKSLFVKVQTQTIIDKLGKIFHFFKGMPVLFWDDTALLLGERLMTVRITWKCMIFTGQHSLCGWWTWKLLWVEWHLQRVINFSQMGLVWHIVGHAVHLAVFILIFGYDHIVDVQVSVEHVVDLLLIVVH